MKLKFYGLLKMGLSVAMLAAGSVLSYAQTPYITVWKTDNVATSDTNQIIIPATGSYVYSWEEVGNTSNAGTGIASGFDTLTFPHAGTYQLSITPTGSVPLKAITFNNGKDTAKLLFIKQWGTVAWHSFLNAYYGCSNLKITATDTPDLSNVANMGHAFAKTAIDSVPRMNNWNMSHVTGMAYMFLGAKYFDQPIGSWDVSHATNMYGLFQGATSFNQPIGNWVVSSVTTMGAMFMEASSFNQPIGGWDVSNVTDMLNMFRGAVNFNQPIGNWNVGNVITMQLMFQSAKNFNQPLNSWNVSNVTNMGNMFANDSDFNQNIDTWNVSKVTEMSGMFSNAFAFDQNIGNWHLDSLTNASDMLDNNGISCSNYGLILEGWASSSHTPDSVSLGAYNLTYDSATVTTSRNYLINTLSWTITDDLAGDCSPLALDIVIFTARKANRQVILEWTTASSDNDNRGFGIERSPDGRSWARIGFVPGQKDNKSNKIDYLFTDNAPLSGSNFYRLKCQAVNNSANYSEVRKVSFGNGNELLIHPNPATNFVQVSDLEGQEVIKLVDLTGRVLISKKAIGSACRINLSGIADGIYLLRIERENGIIVSKKITKQS